MPEEKPSTVLTRDALSLISAHYDGDDARFREVSERIAADLDSAGRGELASFIRAQMGTEPSWVPMDLVPMDQEDKPCAD